MCWRRVSIKGFTLVESLVATTIFLIVSGVFVVILAKGIEVWQDARIKGSFKEEALLFLEEFKIGLRNRIELCDSKFQIEEQKVSFTTLKGSIYNIGYKFDRDKKVLYRYKASYPVATFSVQPVLVLKNIIALNFSCEYEKTIPKTVKINLTASDEQFKGEYVLEQAIELVLSEG